MTCSLRSAVPACRFFPPMEQEATWQGCLEDTLAYSSADVGQTASYWKCTLRSHNIDVFPDSTGTQSPKGTVKGRVENRVVLSLKGVTQAQPGGLGLSLKCVVRMKQEDHKF